MKRHLRILAACALSWGAMGAQAQQVGLYSGFTEAGHQIDLEVGTDPATGQLAVTTAYLSYDVLCQKTGLRWGSSIATGTDFAISGGRYAGYQWLYHVSFALSGTFAADGTVTGRLVGGNAMYVQNSFATENCPSGKLGYSASYVGPGSARKDVGAAAPGDISMTTPSATVRSRRMEER